MQSTLFSVGFKRKTDATTGAELEAAAAARAEQDTAGFKQADEAAATTQAKLKEQVDAGKKQLSQNPDAVRKRREYEKKKRVKKGDGKDVTHKDGNPRNNGAGNLGVLSRSKNRSFKRTRRAKKAQIH